MAEKTQLSVSTQNGSSLKPSPLARFGDKLRTWKPGESGNPAGKPKQTPLTKRLRALARQKAEAEAFARAQFDMAQNPESSQAVAAAKLILDRVEGPVESPGAAVAVQVVIQSAVPRPTWEAEIKTEE